MLSGPRRAPRGPPEHAPWSGAHLGPCFAIQVAMRAEVLSRWSARNASSMRKSLRVFCGAVGRCGRTSGFTNLSAPFTIGP